VGRTEDYRPILDHWHYSRPDRYQHAEDKINQGILEEWNAGILGLNANRNFLPIVPSFPYARQEAEWISKIRRY
jgi:hypothetical protein